MSDQRIAAKRQELTVEVKATEMDVFKQAVALLSDAYEALCSARSEGWDVFSGPTREEVCGVMDAIDAFVEDSERRRVRGGAVSVGLDEDEKHAV